MNTNPWAPYEPTADNPWDACKVAHLHRRAGFGATLAEIRRDLAAGPAASVDRLLDPPEPSADEAETIAGLHAGAVTSGDVGRLRASWLYRMQFGPDPLREHLTLFWHGHFATSVAKVASVRAMAAQNETLRRLALDRFDTLLAAMVADPAMLAWLDGGSSRKERPNENFAREFLELFAIGPGPYTEADIREAARAFTGWMADGRSTGNDRVAFRFDPTRHDDGVKTFLGRTGAWNAGDIIRITLERPEAASFLARKLYRAIVDETAEPPDGLLGPLAEALRSSDYTIRPVVGMILRSRHFYSEEIAFRRMKSPAEFLLGLARALEIPRASLNLLAVAYACERQGQALFAPPNVKGWDGGPAWITSRTLLERLNGATDLVWGNDDRGIAAFDPIAWAGRNSLAPRDAAEALVDLLLPGALAPEARALVVAPGRNGSPDGLRKTLQRIAHTPNFQVA